MTSSDEFEGWLEDQGFWVVVAILTILLSIVVIFVIIISVALVLALLLLAMPFDLMFKQQRYIEGFILFLADMIAVSMVMAWFYKNKEAKKR